VLFLGPKVLREPLSFIDDHLRIGIKSCLKLRSSELGVRVSLCEDSCKTPEKL
jgi:hypothetical protein